MATDDTTSPNGVDLSPQAQQLLTTIRSWSQKARGVERATVVSIPFIIGSGTATITAGIQGAVPVEFRGRITGIRIMEFDAVTAGRVTLDIQKAQQSALLLNPTTPVFASIVTPGTVPTIGPTSGRYYSDDILLNWNDLDLERGDYLRLHVLTVTSFRRLSVSLRVRRKEP